MLGQRRRRRLAVGHRRDGDEAARGAAAAAAGIATSILSAQQPALVATLLGGSRDVGTTFLPGPKPLRSHKRWIMALLPRGALTLDAGAARAVRNGSTLFAAGVRAATGGFHANEAVRILDESGSRGRARRVQLLVRAGGRAGGAAVGGDGGGARVCGTRGADRAAQPGAARRGDADGGGGGVMPGSRCAAVTRFALQITHRPACSPCPPSCGVPPPAQATMSSRARRARRLLDAADVAELESRDRLAERRHHPSHGGARPRRRATTTLLPDARLAALRLEANGRNPLSTNCANLNLFGDGNRGPILTPRREAWVKDAIGVRPTAVNRRPSTSRRKI